MAFIKYTTLEEATARDAEFWAAVRGPGWKPGDITQYVYGRRERTGDQEADEGLPEEGDYFITVAARDDDLDTLITADVTAPREAGECAELYPTWAIGVAYAVDDLVEYESSLYRCRQAHTSQSDWTPPAVLALWLVYRKNADQLLEWVGAEPVQVGTRRTYGGNEYECLQAHVTQADWIPPNVPTLWQLISAPTPEWQVGVYYTGDNTAGAGNGDVVTYNGNEYRCLQSHTSIVTWTPPNVPALWLAL